MGDGMLCMRTHSGQLVIRKIKLTLTPKRKMCALGINEQDTKKADEPSFVHDEAVITFHAFAKYRFNGSAWSLEGWFP